MRATSSVLPSVSQEPTVRRPAYSRAIAATCGAIARQGAHQAAVKSMRTGRGAFATSASKLVSVISRTSSERMSLFSLCGHAREQIGLGAVEEHGDVTRRDAERL